MPIRVLHILHSMNRGGAENAIMNYYRNVDRNLVQFDFLLTAPDKCDFEDEIISLGGNVYRVPLLSMTNPIPYYKGVKKFFHEHSYKIVHSHTSSKSAIPLWIAKNMGIPVRIAHSHGSKSEKGLNGWIRNLLKTPLKKVANYKFACGEDAACWLYGKDELDKGNVRIIRNVIDSDKFKYDVETRQKFRRLLNINDSTLLLGLTARFHPVKNHIFAIDILDYFLKQKKDTKLLLIGDGELKADIRTRAKTLGIESSIIFTGVVNNVNEYLQAMDIFLMPSFNEGLPLSLIEAQIAGLSCIVSTGVPTESNVTGLVKFLPLALGTKEWAKEIEKAQIGARTSQADTIKKAGYDAKTSAMNLQNFYLNVYPK